MTSSRASAFISSTTIRPGTAYMTFDDRTKFQFLPATTPNAEVTLHSGDSTFLSDCLINAQNPLNSGLQLLVSGAGTYDYRQTSPDRLTWLFDIDQPLQCAVTQAFTTPPAGNYTAR